MNSLSQRVKRVRPLLGTYVEIELSAHASADHLNSWITEGFEAVSEVDRLMSFHRSDSDLSRLNQAAPGQWIDINPLTMKVLRASNELWVASKGVFDIRHPSFPAVPGGEPIHGPPTEAFGGDDNCRIRKSGPWTFDLGGIAKGFAVDHAVETIQRLSRGHRTAGVVNAGGDLRRWGGRHAPVAVATSAVRTAENTERLSPARHVCMPGGKTFLKEKAASVFSDQCLWSDALTKVVLMGTQAIARDCLSSYHAHAIVFGK